MNIYPVAEHELEAIGTMNVFTTVVLTIGVALISLGAGILINYAFIDKPTPEGNALAKLVAPIFGALGIIFLIMSAWTHWKRKSMCG